MENNVVPAGSYRIIVADLKNKKIVVDEEAICIVGAFTRLEDLSGKKVYTSHCMAFSKYTAGAALFTAEAAEDAAVKMKKGAHMSELRAFIEKVKRFFKKREGRGW